MGEQGERKNRWKGINTPHKGGRGEAVWSKKGKKLDTTIAEGGGMAAF